MVAVWSKFLIFANATVDGKGVKQSRSYTKPEVGSLYKVTRKCTPRQPSDVLSLAPRFTDRHAHARISLNVTTDLTGAGYPGLCV